MRITLSLLALSACVIAAVAWFVQNEYTQFLTVADQSIGAVSTAPQDDINGWTFAVVGDTEGINPISTRIVEALKQENIDFVAHLGDIAEGPDAEEMQNVLDLFAELEVPTYYIPGNNDLIYDETIEEKTLALYSELVTEDAYYAMDYENARLFFMDNSYRRYGIDTEQQEWFISEHQESSQPFKIAFYHKPIHIPGAQLLGDDESPYSRARNDEFAESLNTYPLDMIFNGHVHTTLQYNINGSPVIISGGGGAEPHTLLGGADAAIYHYLLVTVPFDESEDIAVQLVPVS